MGEERAGKSDLILVLNSGSSSLKVGVYCQGTRDEEPVLTGSAEGIGRSNGSLRISSGDGKKIVQRDGGHESQDQALSAVAEAMRGHSDMPVAVCHRVVHGGPKLRTHQRITPHVLEELRAATHFAPLHIPQALALIGSAQKIFSSAGQFACFDDAFKYRAGRSDVALREKLARARNHGRCFGFA